MLDHAIPDLPTTAGLRERKKAATRRALCLTALRLAVERGLDNVLVEDIAAGAGVSPRTFNNYFSSKLEAICALAVDRAERIGKALRERPRREPLWDAIVHSVLAQYGEADKVPDKAWIAGLRLVTRAPALRGEYLKGQGAMQRALAEAIAERTGADVEREMFPRIVAGAVTSACDVAIDQWLKADPPPALTHLVRSALEELAHGLGSERPARKRRAKSRKNGLATKSARRK